MDRRAPVRDRARERNLKKKRGDEVALPYEECRTKFAAARQARVEAFPEGPLKDRARAKMLAKQRAADERRAKSLAAMEAKAAAKAETAAAEGASSAISQEL